MIPNHHADDATIIAYGAGTLPESFSVILAAHAEVCTACETSVICAEEIGGTLVSGLPDSELSATGLDAVWERIASEGDIETTSEQKTVATDVPRALADLLPGGLETVRWQTLIPGIKQHVFHDVESGKGSLRLLRIEPGTRIPEHSHNGAEMTLLLTGSYRDETGRYQRGDLADMDSSVTHQPVVDSEEPCICLIATDDKLHFSGMFNRLMQPILGI